MPDRLPDPLDCRSFDRFLYAFQAGELSEADRERFRGHAGSCGGCARRVEIEASFLRGLEGRLERLAAPPGLETRIRAALLEEAPDAGPPWRAWLARPWFAVTAAAALLMGLLVGLPAFRSPAAVPAAESLQVRQEGTIVDYDCDLSGMPLVTQRKCDQPLHLNALKLADASYVHFSLDGRAARELTGDRALRGVPVAVTGEYYPGIHTLKVEAWERLGGVETAAWRPPRPDAVPRR